MNEHTFHSKIALDSTLYYVYQKPEFLNEALNMNQNIVGAQLLKFHQKSTKFLINY